MKPPANFQQDPKTRNKPQDAAALATELFG